MTLATKERPILFSAPMVRAILSGAKTQTRRVVKCECNGMHLDRLLGEWPLSSPPFQVTQEHLDDGFLRGCRGGHDPAVGDWVEQYQTDVDDYATAMVRCPYGQPGDRLWVREAWAADRCYDHLKPCEIPEGSTIYRGEEIVSGWHKKRPSIHMPRSASRIDLDITGVRVERLQEISEADAMAEGCGSYTPAYMSGGEIVGPDGVLPSDEFRDLWQSISGPDSWVANRWVWVIEFQRIGGAS